MAELNPDDAAILRRNRRRLVPILLTVHCGIAAVIYVGRDIALIWPVLYVLTVTPLTVWIMYWSVDKMIRRCHWRTGLVR